MSSEGRRRPAGCVFPVDAADLPNPRPHAFVAPDPHNVCHQGYGNNNNSELLEAEKTAAGRPTAGAAGGPRLRGSQMFMLSSTADQPNNRAHVAIAGTSSHLHPSDRGGTAFPTYRGVGSIGIAGGGGSGGGADGLRSSSGSHSPLHPRRFSVADHARRDSSGGGGGGGGMVPAEAESAPAGMEFPPILPGDDGVGAAAAAAGGRGGGKKRSKKRRGGGSRSSSSRRDRSHGSDGGMRPAMPDDGPTMDEMRPSPGDGSGAPGPWGP